MEKGNLMLPTKIKKVFNAPPYKRRMFIKKHSNQMVLKEAAKNKEWPDFTKIAKNDTGMEEENEMVDKLPMSITKNIPGKSFLSIFQELSLKSSSTSIFQVINEDLLEDLAAYCKGNKEKNFVTGLENFAL
jgi:hypothetical protein